MISCLIVDDEPLARQVLENYIGQMPGLTVAGTCANAFEAYQRLQTTAVAAGLPTTLLLDRRGCEIGVLQGPAVWDSPDGDSVIKVTEER